MSERDYKSVLAYLNMSNPKQIIFFFLTIRSFSPATDITNSLGDVQVSCILWQTRRLNCRAKDKGCSQLQKHDVVQYRGISVRVISWIFKGLK